MAQSAKRNWEINESAFGRFLGRLDDDQTRAAEIYEEMRKRTIRYLESRGVCGADVWADEVMDRTVRRLDTDSSIEEPRSYVAGVARMVVREAKRSSKSEQEALHRMRKEEGEEAAEPVQSEDPRLVVLRRCLEAFPEEERTLLLQYYAGRERQKIDGRKGLCQTLGIGAGALRARTFRLRSRLETALKGELSLTEASG